MQTPSLIVFVYAAVVALGGIMGYAQAKSLPSLLAGVASGVILLIAGWALQNGQRWGFFVALLVTTFLLLFFGGRFVQSRNLMPGGLMVMLSFVVLALLLLTGRSR